MLDNLLGGEEEPADDEESTGSSDGMFDDPLDGELSPDGDAMGAGEDLMGGDGPTAESGGGDAVTSGELSNRMDDLEDEVASMASTVETVQSEHEGIRDAVDDVEENVRKLLEVYEMVTRGVNPFVDEQGPSGVGAGSDAGSLGLFDGDEQAEAATGPDTATEPEPEVDADGADEVPAEADETAGEDEETDADGQSFEELKSKYESAPDALDGDEDADSTGATGRSDATDADGESDVADVDTAATDDSASAGSASAGSASAGSASANGAEAGKPYLQELPAGYAADVVVLDWLEFLVDEAGVDGAAGTIAYYEAIDWLSASAADGLQTYLQGFGEEVETDPEPRSWLTIGHHEASLRFVGRLADASADAFAFESPLGRARRERPMEARSTAPTPASNGARRHPTAAASGDGEPEIESDGGRPSRAVRDSPTGGAQADGDVTGNEAAGAGAVDGGAVEDEAAVDGGAVDDEATTGADAGDDSATRSTIADRPFAGEAGYGGFHWNGRR
jgi:archaellum component FlaD/FlaE